MSTRPETSVTLFNGTSSIVHGEIVRISGVNTFVRAQSDTIAHLAGLIGVNGSGTVGTGGPANIFASGASIDVLFDAGLTPVAGDLVYVSSLAAGRGTNVATALGGPIGTIEDTRQYSRTRIVTISLSISGANVGGVTSVSVAATDLTNGNTITPSTGAVKVTNNRGLVWVPTFGPGLDMGPALNTALLLAAIQGFSGIECSYGIFEIATLVTPVGNGQHIKGQGRGLRTEFRCRAAAALPIYVDVSNLYGVDFEDISFTATAPLTSGDMLRIRGADTVPEINTFVPTAISGTRVRHCDFIGGFNCVNITDSATPRATFDVRLLDVNVQPCNGGVGITVNTTGGIIFIDQATINTLVPAAATEAMAGIRVRSCGDCTIDNTSNYQCQYGLLVDPPVATTVNALKVSNSFFDTNSVNNIFMEAAGSVLRSIFTNVWCAGANVHGGGIGTAGINVWVGAGCKDTRFVGCQSYECDAAGVCFFANSGSTRTFFDACSAGGGHIGFGAGGAADVVAFRGCDVGNGVFSVTDLGYFFNGAATNTLSVGNTVHATTPTSGAPTFAASTAISSY